MFSHLIDEIVDDFGGSYGDVEFNITGGDPLLFSGLWELVSHIRSKDATCTLLTSGIGITGQTAARLRDHGVGQVQVSIEGPEEIDDQIRGWGHFRSACQAISYLRQAGIKVSICTTVSKMNIDTVPMMIKWCNQQNLFLGFQRWIPLGEYQDECLVDTSRWWQLVCHVADLWIEGQQVRMNDPLFGWVVAQKQGRVESTRCSGMQFGCTIGVSGVTIMHNGAVLPCRKLPMNLGNVFTTRLMRIWLDSPELWRFRNRDSLNGACGACPGRSVCAGCRAYAYAVKGDPYGDDPMCGSDSLC